MRIFFDASGRDFSDFPESGIPKAEQMRIGIDRRDTPVCLLHGNPEWLSEFAEFVRTGDLHQLPEGYRVVIEPSALAGTSRNLVLSHVDSPNTDIIISGFGWTEYGIGDKEEMKYIVHPPDENTQFIDHERDLVGSRADQIGSAVVDPDGTVTNCQTEEPLGAYFLSSLAHKQQSMILGQELFEDMQSEQIFEFPELLATFAYEGTGMGGMIYARPKILHPGQINMAHMGNIVREYYLKQQFTLFRSMALRGYTHMQLHAGNKGLTYGGNESYFYIGDLESLVCLHGYSDKGIRVAFDLALGLALGGDLGREDIGNGTLLLNPTTLKNPTFLETMGIIINSLIYDPTRRHNCLNYIKRGLYELARSEVREIEDPQERSQRIFAYLRANITSSFWEENEEALRRISQQKEV